MSFTIAQNARAVLLPAFDGLVLSDAVRRMLDNGGLSVLLGESREEYVAREMSPIRRRWENAQSISAVTASVRSRAGDVIVAVDQELGGICRLHDLVPSFPDRTQIPTTPSSKIEEIAERVARGARTMGVNCFLSPVLDVLSSASSNRWLKGRTFSQNPGIVATLSAAYIRGAQRGGVAATGKHFPGFSTTTGDPAIDELAINPLPAIDVEAVHEPFHAAIAAGVEMIMVGPAIVAAYDRERAALRSKSVVDRLRSDFGFEGIVMADDLDSKATMRGDTVTQVALDALNAGCDYLLLADTGRQLDDVALAIEDAAEKGTISAERLANSADRLRALAAKYSSAE